MRRSAGKGKKIGVAIACVVLVGLVAIAFSVGLLTGGSDRYIVQYGSSEPVKCSSVTRIVPKNNEGKPLASYKVELIPLTTEEGVAQNTPLLYVDGEAGFSMDGFGDLPAGTYALKITDDATGKEYDVPVVELDPNGTDPGQLDLEPGDDGEGASSDGADAAEDQNMVTPQQYCSPSTSSWISEYEGEKYSGGVSMNGQYAAAMSFEGVKDVGVLTSSLLVRDGHLYYIDGSNGIFGGSIYRQKLDGTDRVMVAKDVNGTRFFIVGDRLYYNTVVNGDSSVCRVPLGGGVVEQLGEAEWAWGASDAYLFYSKESKGKLWRYEPTQEVEFELNIGPNPAFATHLDMYQMHDGRLFTFQGNTLTVYEMDGMEVFSATVKGADSERYRYGSYYDEQFLYTIENGNVLIVALENGEVANSVKLAHSGADYYPTLLYADEDSFYFCASLSEVQKGISGENYNMQAYRQNRQTGELHIVASWLRA